MCFFVLLHENYLEQYNRGDRRYQNTEQRIIRVLPRLSIYKHWTEKLSPVCILYKIIRSNDHNWNTLFCNREIKYFAVDYKRPFLKEKYFILTYSRYINFHPWAQEVGRLWKWGGYGRSILNLWDWEEKTCNLMHSRVHKFSSNTKMLLFSVLTIKTKSICIRRKVSG